MELTNWTLFCPSLCLRRWHFVWAASETLLPWHERQGHIIERPIRIKRKKMPKIEAKDHREALSQNSLFLLTKAMEESQPTNPEVTLDENTADPNCKYISDDLPKELMSSQAKAVIKTTDEDL
ncbi:doublecortin domain-containing protein 1-like isoform X2 [Castor canadensis]|uniref:Doublecortin domain-containing protein 1-like isoform X2 n=1 Tax=Castor canadensis TaxID=51338 RepID=A0AC58LHY1_CASCN